MEEILNNSKKDRIWELDFLRGFCVILMIFDHFCYDLVSYSYQWYDITSNDLFYSIYSLSYDYYFTLELRQFVEPLVVMIFCTLCGISCSFSKSNIKRATILAVCSILISIVTNIIDAPINFGIFHCLTIAIYLWCIINFICKKDKTKTAFVCGIVGVAIIIMNYVFNSIFELNNTAFTDSSKWYFIGDFMRADNSWINYDDQPIFPLVGYMMLGAAFGPIIYMKKKSLLPFLGKYDWYAPFNFWGKAAMWVYIFHQIVIAGLLGIISLFITGKFLLP